MRRTDRRVRLCMALLVCNLVFIWGNSLVPGAVSEQISDAVKEFLSRFFSGTGQDPQTSGHIIRKLAHFTEFTALGLLLSWLFAMLGRGRLLPLLCGGAAACVDETIQIFVPDRGPSIKDVGIDTCGVILGIMLLTVGYTLKNRNKAKKSLEDTI